MKYDLNKQNITVVVSKRELEAIDAYLRPFCGSRGPFIRRLVLEKIGYKPEPESPAEVAEVRQ